MKKIIALTLALLMLLPVIPVVHAESTINELPESLIKYGSIIMKKGEDYAYVRGELKSMPAPIEKDGVMYFPIKHIAEFLNCRTEVNNKKQTLTWFYQTIEYIFESGKDTFIKYESMEDTKQVLSLGGTSFGSVNGDLYVPLSKIAEDEQCDFPLDGTQFRYGEFDGGICTFGTDEARYEIDEYTKKDKKFLTDLFAVKRHPNTIQKTFYLDPANGRDSYNGTLKYPFRSLDVMLEELRKYKESNVQNGDIVIYLRGGRYNLSKPLEFNEKDGGANGYKVIWKAYPGEEVIISSGRLLENWEKVDDKVYRHYLGSGVTITNFFEGENFCNLARYPNYTGDITKDYITALSAAKGPDKNEFRFREGDLPHITDWSEITWAGWPGGPYGHWNWFYQKGAVKDINYNTTTVKLDGSRLSYVLGTGTRYIFEGSKQFLDAPLEYYYDKNEGYIYYIPLNKDINNAGITLPISNLMKISGTDNKQVIENLRFEGIKFRNSSSTLVTVDQFANVQFDGCEFRNSGDSGVSMVNSYQSKVTKRQVGLDIRNSGFFNIGSAAVSGTGLVHPDDVMSKYHVIKNNRIDNGSIVSRSADLITLYYAGYSYIGQNECTRGNRHGIRLGGTDFTSKASYSYPGYQTDEYLDKINSYDVEFYRNEDPSRNNVIESNYLSHMMSDSQDGGAIYMYNSGINNIYKNNMITKNTVMFSGMNALYSDNQCHNTSIYDNIVYANMDNDATSNGSFEAICFNTGNEKARAWNNVIAKNPISKNARMQNIINFVTENKSYLNKTAAPDAYIPAYDNSFAKNVAYDSSNTVFENYAKGDSSSMHLLDNNLYFHTNGLPFTSVGSMDQKDMMSANNATQEQHTLFGEDPMFMNVDDGDLRYHYTSPVYKLSHHDINRQFGLTEDYTLSSGAELDRVEIWLKDSDTDGFAVLEKGETVQNEIRLKDKDGYIIRDGNVTYTTDNPNIATVDANGLITATGNGVARVTVTCAKGDKTIVRYIDVLVGDRYAKIEADSTLPLLAKGEIGTIRNWYVSNYGRLVPTGDVTYTSTNPDIVSVDENGRYTAKEIGTASIIVKDTATGFVAEVPITIKNGLFKNFTMNVETNLVKVGEDYKITINPQDEKGNPVEIPAETVEFTSSDDELLTVEQVSSTEYKLVPHKAGNATVKLEIKCDGTTRTQRANMYILSESDEVDDDWSFSNYGHWNDSTLTPTTGSFVKYNSGIFSLTTTGENFWANEDQGTFGFKKIKLDPNNPVAEIILKFNVSPFDTNIPGVGNNKLAAGIMMRSADTADARDFHLRYETNGSTLAVYRNEIGGPCGYSKGNQFSETPELRLIYNAGTVLAYYRKHSEEPWTMYTSNDLVIDNNELYIGIAAYSGNRYENEGEMIPAEMLGSVQVNVGKDVDMSELGYDITNATNQ